MDDFNVNEWIYYFFIKDEDALKELIAYYRPLVISILDKKVLNFRDDPNRFYDCLSRADTQLVECIYRYHLGFRGSFTAFYRQCFMNETINIIKKNVREYRLQFNSISFEEKVSEELFRYNSEVIADQSCDVHEQVMIKLLFEELIQEIMVSFEEDDLKILYLKRKGFTNKEIGTILGKNKRIVDYRIHKIKKYLLTH